MKRILILFVLLVVCAGCAGMTPGSGRLVSRSFDLAGFSRIDANSVAQVQVTRGETFRVDVEVDDNLADRLDVTVTGDTLSISLVPGPYHRITLRARVTMPELTGVKLDGASELTATLDGEDVDLDLNGASHVTLTGSAGRVMVKLNGASEALLGGLDAGDVDLEVNGASDLAVRSHGAVRGRANGASDVTVSGEPTSVEVTAEGASEVKTR